MQGSSTKGSNLVCAPNCFIIHRDGSVEFLSDRRFSLGSDFVSALRALLSEQSQQEIDKTKRLKVIGSHAQRKREREARIVAAQQTALEVQAGKNVVLQGVAFGEAQLRVFGLSGTELLQLLGGRHLSSDTIRALYFLLHLGDTVPPPSIDFFSAVTLLFTAPPESLPQLGPDPARVASEPPVEQPHVDQAAGGSGSAMPSTSAAQVAAAAQAPAPAVPSPAVNIQAPCPRLALAVAAPPESLPQLGLDPAGAPTEPPVEQLHADQAAGGSNSNMPSTSAAQVATAAPAGPISAVNVQAPCPRLALVVPTPPESLPQLGLDPAGAPTEPPVEQLHADQAAGGSNSNMPSTSAAQSIAKQKLLAMPGPALQRHDSPQGHRPAQQSIPLQLNSEVHKGQLARLAQKGGYSSGGSAPVTGKEILPAAPVSKPSACPATGAGGLTSKPQVSQQVPGNTLRATPKRKAALGDDDDDFSSSPFKSARGAGHVTKGQTGSAQQGKRPVKRKRAQPEDLESITDPALREMKLLKRKSERDRAAAYRRRKKEGRAELMPQLNPSSQCVDAGLSGGAPQKRQSAGKVAPSGAMGSGLLDPSPSQEPLAIEPRRLSTTATVKEARVIWLKRAVQAGQGSR
ncbi:hypothetical protein N2152v2_006265 [Parachlorella kessleri]